MSVEWNDAAIDGLAKRGGEPTWLTETRRDALAHHARLPWPHPSDEVWRRTKASLLDPMQGFSLKPIALLDGLPLGTRELAGLTQPLGDEVLLARANGSWLTDERPIGLEVDSVAHTAHRAPEAIRQALDADGLSEAEQKLTSLNTAFHHDGVSVTVPPGYARKGTIRLVHLWSAAPQQAIFPLTIVTVGAGSVVTLIDEYHSLVGPDGGSADGPHLVNARVELILEEGACVHYVRLQRWHLSAREFLLHRVRLGRGVSLTMANINLGSSLSKAHIMTRFTGEQAASRLYGFAFGQGRQHIDQHTVQDHQAAHTRSDLTVRAALQDESQLVYTGLIRIAKAAHQTEAFQTNHNLLLDDTAQVHTIPMLEILADDVQCKHGASVGPIDEEQTFYLMARGIPREAAERLIVMGFIEPIVEQVPFAPLQEWLRTEIDGSLHREGQGGGGKV